MLLVFDFLRASFSQNFSGHNAWRELTHAGCPFSAPFLVDPEVRSATRKASANCFPATSIGLYNDPTYSRYYGKQLNVGSRPLLPYVTARAANNRYSVT